MEKKYTRKPIRNLTELEKAQDRTRNMYKNMEADWVSNFLQPDAWAFSIGQYLLTGLVRKKRRKNTAERPVNHKRSRAGEARHLSGRKKGRSVARKQGLLQRTADIARGFGRRKKKIDHGAETTPNKSVAFRFLKKLMWSAIYWQAFQIGFRLGRKGGRAIRKRKNRR